MTVGKAAKIVVAVVLLGLAPVGAMADIGDLFGVSRRGDQINQINPATGATISSVTITGVGNVDRATGLAVDPTSGQMFTLLRTGGVRQLATINPHTGAATLVGTPSGFGWAGLAFDGNGTLYGITGDGAGSGNVPESLYTLSTADASPTFVRQFGAGDDGETMAFNSDDGLLYHASGFSSQIFESYNIGTDAVSSIALSGFTYNETTALTYDAANDVFLASDLFENFYSITTGGVVTLLGTDVVFDNYKGLAFEVAAIPAPGAALLAMMGLPMIGWVRKRLR